MWDSLSIIPNRRTPPFPIVLREYSCAAVIPFRVREGCMTLPSPISWATSEGGADAMGGGFIGFIAGGGMAADVGIKGVAIGGGGIPFERGGGGGTPNGVDG